MKVRMLRSISGQRNGLTYPRVGEIMELPERDEAFDLLVNGYAELVIETAEAAPAEIAARVTKPNPRGSHKSFSPRKDEI